MAETEKKTARLFRNGRNQAVRIPREFELDGDEVFVARRGDELILTARPRDWSALTQADALASSGFMRGLLERSMNRWGGL